MLVVDHSQADESKFSTRENFGTTLEAEFNAGANVVKVEYWACFREEHQNDDFHYHWVLKFTGCQNYLSVKIRFAEKHGIEVNISNRHNFYLSAYRYVC